MKKLLSVAMFLFLMFTIAPAQVFFIDTLGQPLPTQTATKLWRVDSIVCLNGSPVIMTIDSSGVVNIPKGWEWVIVIRDGEAWCIDSTLQRKSFPKFNWNMEITRYNNRRNGK
jgi:hypothetical protein